eukprot:49708-Rhodomonas_salina.1
MSTQGKEERRQKNNEKFVEREQPNSSRKRGRKQRGRKQREKKERQADREGDALGEREPARGGERA